MEKIKRTLGFIFTHPLGKRHPFKAFYRFLYWQIQSALKPSKFIQKHFIGDIVFYARKGLTGITGNIYTGLHEFHDMAFLLHFLRAGDNFMDIGANVGSYTLLASGICKAKTLAIEASASTAAITRENININQLQNSVTLINAAAGAETGILRFSKNEDTTNHIIDVNEAQNDTESVNVVTIDSFISNFMPSLIKMDVEGFETEVLKGMADTLNNQLLKAIIIELNGSGARYGFKETDIHELLVTHGFKPYQYNPFTRNLTQLSTYGNNNTIYCRNMDFITDRLKNAPSFSVMGEMI